MAAPPLPEVFGNYVIKGIVEVIPPDAVSWLPTAPAWRLLGLALGIYLLWQALLRLRRWWRNRYRGVAVRAVTELDGRAPNAVQTLAGLLKATALHAAPRSEIAVLSGAAWLQWLNSQVPQTFTGASAELLANGQYRTQPADPAHFEALRESCLAWITLHPDPADA